MSGSTSMSLVPRHTGQHSSLSANHRDTFSVPHRQLLHPHSTGNGGNLAQQVGTSASTPISRLSIKDSSQVHAKNVLFYKSGDTNYESFKVAVTRRNYRTFDSLLENLSEKVSLPFGVRTISTPNGTHGISRLDELEDGKTYICSDRKTVKPLNLNLVKKSRPPWFISKPKTRTRRVQSLARRSAQASQASTVPSRYMQVKTPKKIAIAKNGDPTFRHSILLSRRTHQNFEQILEDVAEIFRITQQRLYTCEGRKVESLQDLFMNGSVFVLAGKEAFIPMEYRIKRGVNDQSKSNSSADNATESARMPKELKRTKGRWRVTVTTSELPAAGTDSRVLLTVYGTKGNSGAIPLSTNNATGPSKSRKLFMSGNEDEFVVNVGFIAEIRKIRVSHDNSGKTSPGWLCEEVIMSDLTTGEVITFPFNRWLSRDEDDGEICRELPAVGQEESSLPVLRYIVSVYTGDLWNAGTEANVYLTLYGTLGDSGARLLQLNGRPKPLHKGATDIFRFEAVDLGNLQRLVIGHDGVGPGAGWYLKKIVVREDRVGADEYVFRCDRWLDEAQDDRKIVRELFVEAKASNSRSRIHSEKSREIELWDQEKWKFLPGNEVMLISKATGKAVRTKPDGSVDGLGPVSHPFDLVKIKESDLGVYKVIRRRGSIRAFSSVPTPSFHLAIDQNRLLGQGKGGTFCEFAIKVQSDRSVVLESCRYPGHFISIDPNGKPADTRGHPNSTGRLFNVYVKGCFRNNSVILLNTSATQALVVTGVGDVVGTGKRGDITGTTKVPTKSPNFSTTPQWAHFRVIKVAEGVRMFQCEKNPRRYLRIKDGQCDGLGTGDVYCHFKVQKYKQGTYVTLQSMKHRGVFIGLSSNGKARPTVDTGDSNTQFFPEVIKFGEKKQSKAEQYRTPEPSFTVHDVPDEIIRSKRSRSPGVSQTRRSEVALIKTREFSSPGPSEGDYRIYVTTGNSGTKEVVTIAAYGDKGKSSNITLGKGHEKGIFQCGQTDEFEANFAEIGRLYKIRIGVEEASSICDWRLKQVKMKDMTTNEIFRFKFNRWISRNKDDGDTLRELPAVLEGAEGELEMLRYHVQVRTSKDSSSFSSKKPPIIYICLFGERGDTGRRLLQRRSCLKSNNTGKDTSRKPFMPNQNDVFEIEAVSLGALTKCTLSCPTSLRNSSKLTSTSSFPAWLCDEVIVKESEGSTTEYVFACKKWLGLKKAGSHATINLSLSEVRDVKQTSSDETDFKDGDWKLCVKTGLHPDAGTSANVTFFACGIDGSNSGNVILQGGTDGKFEPGKTVKFKVALSDVSDLYKVRINHDNVGDNPAWYVESLKLVDPNSDQVFKLPVKKWLAADRESFQLHTEVPIPKPGVETPPVHTYQVAVYTGSILGSDTEANVYVCVYGTKGDTGIRPLFKSKTNSTKFQESQMDLFDLDAVSLGELKKIRIGHDGQGPGSGWFLHKVIIKESQSSNKEWIFFCNRWLDHGQDDGKIEREIAVNPEDDSVQEKLSDGGEYKVLITTGTQSNATICPPDAKVTMVVYGEDGKTAEIPIQSLLGGQDIGTRRRSRNKSRNELRNIVDMSNCFKPGQTDECKVDIPEIGQIYKIRISYSHLSNWKSWYLERIVMEDVATKRQLNFPCNRWLSTCDDDQETVREIAVSNENQGTLKTILYNVAIYTGDRHGAGTDAGAYVLLKGDRGDSGHRFLKKNQKDTSVFQRGGVDMFTIEAVDLGRLVEVIVTHDGEGYGAGWYIEKVTVRAGEFAAQEWVFPCNLWLDDSVGDRKISRRLFPIGVVILDTQEEELEGLGTMSSREGGRDDIWDLNVFVSDVNTQGINRILLTGVFFGSYGAKKSKLIPLGEWSTGGRKRMKMQADLKEIGELYKLRLEIPDYSDSASMFLEYVSMQNLHTKEQLQFAFHCQLHSDSGSTTKELPAIKPDRALPKITRYLVDVSVRPGKGEHIPEGRLRLNLIGDAGDSGYRTLISGLQTFHATEHKNGYVFKMDAIDLGRLSSAALLYDSDGGDKSEGWMVHDLSVSIEDHPSSSAVPVVNSMIYKAEVDQNFKVSASEEPVEKIFRFTEEQSDEYSSYSRKASSYRREESLKSAQKPSEGVWNLTLFYTEEADPPKEEADDMLLIQDLEKYKVSVQVFGTQNSSQTLPLSNFSPKRNYHLPGATEMKVIETCLFLGQEMGTLYLLRFGCTHWDANLFKIKLKDVHTKQEFTHNVTEAQHKKMENTKVNGSLLHFDVPLVRPDIPPQEHHRYKVSFRTGDVAAAGTDADIFVNLYGTHGDTGQRTIDSSRWDAFKRGSVEKFSIETVDVGIPRKISVSHNGVGLGAGWFLEDITVQELRNERKADYVFQCNRWLDDSVDEKVTQNEIYLTGTKFSYPTNFLKPSQGCWKCRLKAKEPYDKDNDEPLIAKVAFYIKHKESDVTLTKVCNFDSNEKEFEVNFPDDDLEGGSAAKRDTRQDTTDDGFYKIRVEVVSGGNVTERKNWPFEELLMSDLHSKEKLHFVFDDAVWDGSSRNVIRELPVMRLTKEPLKICDYYIMFFTSDESTMHSNKNIEVEVMLSGENGDTGWRHLYKKSGSAANPILQPGKMDMLFAEAVDLGTKVKSVSIRVGAKAVRWRLDRVKVKKGFFSKEEFVFECGRWIEPTPGPSGEVKLDLTSTLISHYPPKSRGSPAENGTVEAYDIHTVWDIITRSKDLETENGVKETLPSLAVRIYGANGESNMEFLDDKLSSPKGRCTADIQINPRESLRDLQKIGIGVEGFKENRRSQMANIKKITLLKLSVRNTKTKEYFSFSPGTTIFGDDAVSKERMSKESGTNWIELVPVRPKEDESKLPPIIDYIISVKTGDQEEAGTSANVYLTLLGERKGVPTDGGKRWLLYPPEESKFSRGADSQFEITGVDLGKLKQVVVGHDGNDAKMGWWLERINIRPSNSTDTYVFLCKKWLANLENDTFIERTLDLFEVQSPETIPKRPISVQGRFSEQGGGSAPESRVRTNETLHGSSNNEGEKPQDGASAS